MKQARPLVQVNATPQNHPACSFCKANPTLFYQLKKYKQRGIQMRLNLKYALLATQRWRQ